MTSESPVAPAPAPASPPSKITIDDFRKLQFRVAKVLEVTDHPNANKLYLVKVDLGTEQRQVVAGIAESYAPEALVGKKIALVANLKPAKLMGVESNGMVLAADASGKAVLTTFDADVAPGTKIK